MDDSIPRIFRYAAEFYFNRLGLIVIFSIPFILSILILVLVPAPTYQAIGGVFLRTGSLGDISLLDVIIITVGYALSVFMVADTIVNINIVIRSKRTLTTIKHEVVQAVGSYATRIFYIYTLALLLTVILQLITYENPLQSWIYSILSLALSFLLFFVAPAVVIDNSNTPKAIRRSVAMSLRNPHLFLLWSFIGLFLVSLVKIAADLAFSNPFSTYFVLLVNSLLILPFLVVLQTQMYMEKYPLAR
ncbi:MAG: hypothetical protein U0R44_00660 [Candidatus Micrarchaeia archaeon]